ncbi:AAA family ATPase [Candidatus Dependentiae bacterium]|jgi:hypothetical protein|nr:AAA family ATPase [Candidatus Dependentiae bacterium]
MKRLPIGLSDYKKLIEDNYYYVDKTLLIQELFYKGGIVTLMPRPRRFGKTLNLSMLKYFFEKTTTSHAYLFEDKKIWQIPEMAKLQGKFPVIFITFKSIKESNWQDTYHKIIHLIAYEYRQHSYLLDNDILDTNEKEFFNKITSLSSTHADYQMSLLYLSRFLERYHKAKVIVLIDEYDAPIHMAFVKGYYQEVISFMRGFLTDVLKDNPSLERSIVTGILRTAKEGIFSGLNNLKVATVLQQDFANSFGFTEQEVERLLKDYQLENIHADFRAWYNGYLIGQTKIYNPWSALNCIDESGVFRPYWVNTSDNALINTIIAEASTQVKDACGLLITGNSLPDIIINEGMALPGMLNDANSIWTLLLFSGYLTAASSHVEEGLTYVELILPNKELLILFNTLVDSLFKQSLGNDDFRYLESALRDADGELFEKLLSKFMIQSMSFHDISDAEPEKSYHLFALGLLVLFSKKYAVRSNRESGYGRYDIMLIPQDKTLPGIIIEFKKKDLKESMQKCADRALEQIKSRSYATELESRGVKKIAFFGIACHKKNVLLKQA